MKANVNKLDEALVAIESIASAPIDAWEAIEPRAALRARAADAAQVLIALDVDAVVAYVSQFGSVLARRIVRHALAEVN
jgi:hypothetical protein